MEPKYDVIAMGELLIDFTENGYSEQGNHILEANPGGAPCNVLAMLNRLGKKTSFLGMVGKDQFGVLLRDTLKELGIDTSHLYESEKVHTTLAFVHTLEDGDREFAFYRNPGADMMLKEEHVEVEFVRSAKAFHYGTLSMTHEDVRKATVYAIRAAKEAGLLLSFDPNLRPPLWSDMEEARAQIQYGLSQCDLLKISEEELEFVTGTTDVIRGAKQLKKQYPNIRLMNVTMGKGGSMAFHQDRQVFCRPFLQKETIETTGAGDTFGACVLNYVLEHGIEDLKEEQLYEMLEFANAAASLITTKKGALKVMPTKEAVREFLKKEKANE